MRRRVDIAIDSVTVDASLAGDRTALAAAIEAALRRQLAAPGIVEGLRPSRTEAARAEVARGAGLTDGVGSAVARAVAGGDG
ncbi:MAG TPA: hypothetical protein VMS43_01215 [Allosphingosinicella sp.]|nr:hypothetical protein [Allosphingosinicella sp.]